MDNQVTQADRDAAAQLHGFANYGAVEVYGREAVTDDVIKTAKAFARHRTDHTMPNSVVDLPDYIDLFRIIRGAGRKDADKARAVHTALATLTQQSPSEGLLREADILVRSLTRDLQVTNHIIGVVGGGYVSSREWLEKAKPHLKEQTNEQG